MTARKPPAVRYRRLETGEGYVVLDAEGDRLGIVSCVGGRWHAADTYLVGLRNSYPTRKAAVGALVRRMAKAEKA